MTHRSAPLLYAGSRARNIETEQARRVRQFFFAAAAFAARNVAGCGGKRSLGDRIGMPHSGYIARGRRRGCEEELTTRAPLFGLDYPGSRILRTSNGC